MLTAGTLVAVDAVAEMPGVTSIVSVTGPPPVAGDAASSDPSLSADGRLVAFSSEAGNLAPDDTNDARDVFVHDRATGTTALVSVAPDGEQFNEGARNPALSADGRWVAFEGSTIQPLQPSTITATAGYEDGEAGATARVTGVDGAPAAGSVSFFLCSPPYGSLGPGCPAGGRRIGVPVLLDASGSATSANTGSLTPPVLFDEPGTWCWRVEYAGSDRHEPSRSSDTQTLCFIVDRVEASITTTVQVDPPSFVLEQVSMSGTVGAPTGTATFFVCGPDEVTAAGCLEGTQVGSDELVLAGSGTQSTASFGWTPPSASGNGRYCWRVAYSGDDGYLPSTHTDNRQECFGIDAGEVTLAAPHASIVVVDGAPGGDEVTPGTTATVAVQVASADSADPTATGGVDFFLCRPGETEPQGCLAGGEPAGSAELVDGVAASPATPPLTTAGTYCWRFAYVGDDVYRPFQHTDAAAACFTVVSGSAPPQPGVRTQVYVRDLVAETTTLVSVAPDGAAANGDSSQPAISGDGGLVAFTSTATNLVEAGSSRSDDEVYVRDLRAGTIALVSVRVACPSACSGGDSFDPALSADGRSVAFASYGDDLDALHPVTGEPFSGSGGLAQVYVRDLAAERTTVESLGQDGEPGSGDSAQPALSGDGSRVAFTSDAPTLVENDNNGLSDVFVRNRATTATSRVSVSSLGDEADGSSIEPAISADGRTIAFASTATTLVPDDTDVCTVVDSLAPSIGCHDVFVHDTVRATTSRVSVTPEGGQTESGADSGRPSLSTNARFVAFDSNSNLLDEVDSNQVRDVFVRDRLPLLMVNPDPLNFPPTPVRATSPVATLTVVNAGAGPVSIIAVRLGNGDGTSFVLEPGLDSCTGALLYASDTCTVGLRFVPAAEGEHETMLTVEVVDTPGPISIKVTGTATAGRLALSPEALDFGPQVVGTTSSARFVTAVSIGSAAVQIEDVEVLGSDAPDFRISEVGQGCAGLTLAPDDGCLVAVTFAPAAPGAKAASLRFVHDGSDSPQEVILRGSALAGGRLRLAPDPLDLGVVPTGVTSDPAAVIVANIGDVPVQLGDVQLRGPHAADFELVQGRDDDCGDPVLAPGARCAITLTMTPSAPGQREADLVLQASDAATPHLVGLRGRAPLLVVEPPLGRPGFVPLVIGEHFPASSEVRLAWVPGVGGGTVVTDEAGSFRTRLLVLRRDRIGSRVLEARFGQSVDEPGRFAVETPFLVVPGSGQPTDFTVRR